ncbi:hypothetical protein D9M70_610740 [compost metagenome]
MLIDTETLQPWIDAARTARAAWRTLAEELAKEALMRVTGRVRGTGFRPCLPR